MEIEGESPGGVMIDSNAQVNKFSSMYSLFPVTSKQKENSKVQAPLPQLQGSLIISFMPPHLHPLPKKYNLSPYNELILLNYKKTTLTPIVHATNKVLYIKKTKAIANIAWMLFLNVTWGYFHPFLPPCICDLYFGPTILHQPCPQG